VKSPSSDSAPPRSRSAIRARVKNARGCRATGPAALTGTPSLGSAVDTAIRPTKMAVHRRCGVRNRDILPAASATGGGSSGARKSWSAHDGFAVLIEPVKASSCPRVRFCSSAAGREYRFGSPHGFQTDEPRSVSRKSRSEEIDFFEQ